MRSSAATRSAARFLSAARLLAAALCVAATNAAPAAESYPSMPIKIVVPSTAGSNTDLVARVIAQKMSELLGQPVVVEDAPGAGGAIATQKVKNAPADGYTVLAVSNTFATTPSTLASAGYDPVRDFTGVTQTASLPLLLVVHPSQPVKSVKELITFAKARPNEMSYGSVGTGSFTDLAIVQLTRMAGIEVMQVPYKGGAAVQADLLANRITFMLDTINTAAPHVRGGTLRALGVASERRSPVFPDIPTIAEAGVPGYDMPVFNGLAVRAGTPRHVIDKLHSTVVRAVSYPEIRDKFVKDGQQLVASESPEAFTEFLKREVARYADIARQIAK